MRMSIRHAVLVSCLIAGTLIVPAGSQAATATIGSNLAATPTGAVLSTDGIVNTSITPGAAAPGGALITANGTITGWRVKTGVGGATGFKFTVVRGNTAVYIGNEVNVLPAGGISTTFPENAVVQPGDKIGVIVPGLADSVPILTGGLGTMAFWSNALTLNETRAPDGNDSSHLLLQADFETPASPGAVPTGQRAAALKKCKHKKSKKKRKKCRNNAKKLPV
jgi:hypothetical protein